MNAAALADAIRDRLRTDTGSGGLFNSGTPLLTDFYYGAIPRTAVMPYAVLSFASAVANDAFAKEIDEVVFRISISVARTSTTISDPVQRGANIIDRVHGDSSGGSAPTYGLHRWTIGTVGSWTATTVRRVQTFDEHTEDDFNWVLEYQVPLSK